MWEISILFPYISINVVSAGFPCHISTLLLLNDIQFPSKLILSSWTFTFVSLRIARRIFLSPRRATLFACSPLSNACQETPDFHAIYDHSFKYSPLLLGDSNSTEMNLERTVVAPIGNSTTCSSSLTSTASNLVSRNVSDRMKV